MSQAAEKKHQCKYVYTQADQAAWQVNHTEIPHLHRPGTVSHRKIPDWPHKVGDRCRAACKIVGSNRTNMHYDDFCASHMLGRRGCVLRCRYLAGVDDKKQRQRKKPGDPLYTRRHQCRNCAQADSFYCKKHDVIDSITLRMDKLRSSNSSEGNLWRWYDSIVRGAQQPAATATATATAAAAAAQAPSSRTSSWIDSLPRFPAQTQASADQSNPPTPRPRLRASSDISDSSTVTSSQYSGPPPSYEEYLRAPTPSLASSSSTAAYLPQGINSVPPTPYM